MAIALNEGGNPVSDTSAHISSATVATFRSWRSSQIHIAKSPTELPLTSISILSIFASFVSPLVCFLGLY